MGPNGSPPACSVLLDGMTVSYGYWQGGPNGSPPACSVLLGKSEKSKRGLNLGNLIKVRGHFFHANFSTTAGFVPPPLPLARTRLDGFCLFLYFLAPLRGASPKEGKRKKRRRSIIPFTARTRQDPCLEQVSEKSQEATFFMQISDL